MTLLDQFVQQYSSIWSQSFNGCLYCESWDNINRQDEVKAIRSYITAPGVGLDFLNQKVAPLFRSSSFEVKFAGVFCHQKPTVHRTPAALKAHPSPKSRCELGDLLVAFLLLDSAGNLQYYASSLFQAKTKDKLDNITQQYLYEKDSSFILPKYLMSATRHLPADPEERSIALRYLLMGAHREVHKIDAQRSPWSNNLHVDWMEFIHELLQGREGLKAIPGPSGSDWDIINHDLLVMASKVPMGKDPRGNNVASQLATGVFNSFASNERWFAESEGGGVPVMLVIAAAKEPFEFEGAG